jgi:phosphinothricin acetyltransferase
VNFHIQPATVQDLPVINDIYNYYVTRSTCTYQTDPETPESRREWFARHDAAHPVIVVEQDGQVVAWGSLTQLHSRQGYRVTVEDSIYVRHDMHRRGIGQAILLELIQAAKTLGYHSIIASISADQDASVELHRKNGFVQVGRLREVGWKFDRLLDVMYMQLMLDAIPNIRPV